MIRRPDQAHVAALLSSGDYSIDHEPTTEDLIMAWESLERNALVPRVFYDGYVRNEHEFLAFCRSEWVQFYLLRHQGRALGMAWLTHFEGKTARIHFSGFGPGTRRHAVNLGLVFTHWALTAELAGEQWLNTLIGATPAHNKAALRLIERLGFRVVATIPEAVVPVQHDGPVDMIISYLNRGGLS